MTRCCCWRFAPGKLDITFATVYIFAGGLTEVSQASMVPEDQYVSAVEDETGRGRTLNEVAWAATATCRATQI